MAWTLIELVGGIVLAALTLKDVFDTVVVPGPNRGGLQLTRRLVFATLPLWRLAGRRRSIPTSFAPFVLLASFVIWMLLLALAFGLMAHALRSDFRPPPRSFFDAVFLVASGLVTLGLSGVEASGAVRVVVLAAGFCGLAVMTMAVTYLLEVQSGIAGRDAGIIQLTTSAGAPPSGVALLERFAGLDFKEHVPEVMRKGREWCAQVLQSHAAHPSLVYFRSKGTGPGWPAALGALLDLALAAELLIDAPEWRGLATLLGEDGGRMASSLVEQVGLQEKPAPPNLGEVDQLVSRLASAGYPVQPSPDTNAFCARRASYAACIRALASHLGSAEAPLLGPDRRTEGDAAGGKR